MKKKNHIWIQFCILDLLGLCFHKGILALVQMQKGQVLKHLKKILIIILMILKIAVS